MKTSVIEVRDMLSVLSVLGVEELIGKVPGVESVTLNHAAGNATVRYDETRLEIADIKSAVRQLGYEGADAPAPVSAASKAPAPQDKAASSAAPSTTPKPAPATSAATPAPTPTPEAPKPPQDAPAAAPATAAHASEKHDKAAPGKS
ncbi:MAG: heavy-metal-associated domain-containing protein [Burkholderiaceae bacterium]